jgi:FMN reductase
VNSLTAILGSPFSGSSSEKIVNLVIESLPTSDWNTRVIDLSKISSDALLLRKEDETLNSSIDYVVNSTVIIAATPTYRATYTGLIKSFFDQLPADSLAGKLLLPIQTGGSPEHSLSIEYGLVPMVRTLGALVSTKPIFSWNEHWNEDGSPTENMNQLVNQSVEEIVSLCN